MKRNKIMIVKNKPIEALEFTGDNFEELKSFCPKLEKYTFREGYPYTVGWSTAQENGMPEKVNELGIPEMFTEALPGFFIVKNKNVYRIYDPEEFETTFQ